MTSTKNGIGVILDKEIKISVVDVGRKCDIIIKVKLIRKEKVYSVISLYAPQVRCKKKRRKSFGHK